MLKCDLWERSVKSTMYNFYRRSSSVINKSSCLTDSLDLIILIIDTKLWMPKPICQDNWIESHFIVEAYLIWHSQSLSLVNYCTTFINCQAHLSFNPDRWGMITRPYTVKWLNSKSNVSVITLRQTATFWAPVGVYINNSNHAMLA